MASRPAYVTMDQNYITGTADDVKAYIGGKVNADWITNTCAIRISGCLNYSGYPLPANAAGLHVVSGDDKKFYAYRMRELANWLTNRFGAPDIGLKKPSKGTISRADLAGIKGIIAFYINFSDATGHIDLWDGSAFNHEVDAGKDYFALAGSIKFWKLP